MSVESFSSSAESSRSSAEGSATRGAKEIPGQNGDGDADVPLPRLVQHLNAGVTFSGMHDAQSGWEVLSDPAVGISFNDVWALDASIAIYNYRLAESTSANPKPNARLVPLRAELGDVVLALHGQFLPRGFAYQPTLSVTAPTGDRTYGLSTGHVTFDLSNHFEHEFKYVTPAIELGVGDSNTLANSVIVRNYTTLGPLAHFQAGLGFPLFWGLSWEANAYEQLPLGDQKIYESITRKHMTTTIVTGRSVSEDNGFTTGLDIPLDDRATLSGYYNHSLRLHDDTVGFSLTYVLRSLNAEERKKKEDDLLRSIHDDLAAPSPLERSSSTPF